MTAATDKASPPKSDAAPLPTVDDSHAHDQPAAEGSSSNSVDDVNMQAISNSLQNGDASSSSMHVDDTSSKPAAPNADDANKPVRSSSVQAAEAAKRRENNFLEKLWK